MSCIQKTEMKKKRKSKLKEDMQSRISHIYCMYTYMHDIHLETRPEHS